MGSIPPQEAKLIHIGLAQAKADYVIQTFVKKELAGHWYHPSGRGGEEVDIAITFYSGLAISHSAENSLRRRCWTKLATFAFSEEISSGNGKQRDQSNGTR